MSNHPHNRNIHVEAELKKLMPKWFSAGQSNAHYIYRCDLAIKAATDVIGLIDETRRLAEPGEDTEPSSVEEDLQKWKHVKSLLEQLPSDSIVAR